MAALPAAAFAAEGQPLSNTTDPSAVTPPPQSDSRPIQTPMPGGPDANPDRAPRFTLTAVEFQGASTLPQEALSPAWRPFAGKTVSLADLHAIARRTEAIYAKAGYPFVAVVLTPQAVTDGVVRFKVVEGRVSSLTVISNDPVARRQAAAAFGGIVERHPLSASVLEGAYGRAKDVPGLAIDGALRQGAVPGGMDLVIRARHRDWRVYANVNNYYPNTVGPWGALVGIDHYGASAYGDQTSLQLYSSIDGGPQQVARLSHRQILNASGTGVSAMVLAARAKPGGAVAPLDLATNVTAGRISVSQPLVERLRFSLGAALSLDASDQETKVFSKVGLTDDRLRIASLGFNGDLVLGDEARVNYSLELRKGLSGLGASRRGDPGLSRFGADPQATVGRLSLDGQTSPFHRLRLYGRFEGQWADAPLTAPEQYAVGNLSIGRGYQPGAAFGDNAAATSVELRAGPYPLGRFRLQPFAFYDTAQLWTKTPGAERDHTLASAGGGLRLETPGKLHLDVIYAVPLDPPLGLGEPTPTPRLLVSLTVGLDDLFTGFHRRSPAGDAK